MNELSSTQEQALDALLAEVHSSSGPPDLSQQILAQLAELETDRQPPRQRSSSDSGISIDVIRPKKSRGSLRPIAIVAAVLAASVVLAISISKFNTSNNDPSIADGNVITQPDGPRSTAVVENDKVSPNTTSVPDPHSDQSAPPNRGIPMGEVVAQSDAAHRGTSTTQVMTPRVQPTTTRSQPIELVASELESDWSAYWKAMGIQPTAEATVDETATRLSRVLDLPISGDSIAEPQRLRDELVSKKLSQQMAALWLERITDGGTKRLKQPVRDELVAEVAEGIRSQQAFDKSFVRLLNGQSKQSSALYTAFSSGGHDALVRRLAAVSMNVDLRCTKCHDALIEGSGRQESYWSFANFIKQGLERSRNGVWSVVDSNSINVKPTFYELADGRQRMVQPSVDSQWMSSTIGQTGNDVREWSSNLVGSPELAQGVVNSIWQLVHGRSLRGHVIDTIAAPHHESLERIERRLTEDLLSSGFDVSRTIALVIASPVSRRSVPDALKLGNELQASDDEIHDAMNSVDAFAASLPVKPQMNVRDRVEIAMNSVGGSLRDLKGGELLANIASGDYRTRKSPAVTLPKDSGYPYKASSLPVQWLASIDNYESQVDHLGYLAGMTQLPQAIHDASKAIRQADGSDELALRRVWWLLRP